MSFTPTGKLASAAAQGDYARTKVLLDDGVSPNGESQDFPGEPWRFDEPATALMAASYNGHIEIVGLLLSAGADVNSMNRYGKTALHFAAHEGHRDIAELLLDHGAGIDAQCQTICHAAADLTPLQVAVQWQRVDVAELLIARGANLEATLSYPLPGWTALHLAAQTGNVAMVRLLVDSGANVNAKARGGFTPVDFAAGDARQYLLDHGATLGKR